MKSRNIGWAKFLRNTSYRNYLLWSYKRMLTSAIRTLHLSCSACWNIWRQEKQTRVSLSICYQDYMTYHLLKFSRLTTDTVAILTESSPFCLKKNYSFINIWVLRKLLRLYKQQVIKWLRRKEIKNVQGSSTSRLNNVKKSWTSWVKNSHLKRCKSQRQSIKTSCRLQLMPKRTLNEQICMKKQGVPSGTQGVL